MLLALTILTLAFLAWVIFKPAWLPPAPDSSVTATISQGAADAYAASRSWWQKLKFWERDQATARQFKAWASEAAMGKRAQLYKALPDDAAQFVAWLDGLTEHELVNYVREVAAFCQANKFALVWLVDARMDKDLKRAVEETIILHCLATWKARDIAALSAYYAWQLAPDKAANRAFAQKLYGHLAANGLTATPSDLLLASDKERQAHVTHAIVKAAAERHDVFIDLVKKTADELAAEAGQKAKQDRPARQVAGQATTPPEVVEAKV